MTINKVTIKNVKGKSFWTHVFDGLCSNKVNLFVAPNGFGKSTITTAFQAVSHGCMKLGKNDYYNDNESNIPRMEIEYSCDGFTFTVASDNSHGDISKTFLISVINSPIYAKSTGQSTANYTSHSAELYIKDIPVCAVREKDAVPYSFSKWKQKLGKGTPNLSVFLSSVEGLQFIIDHSDLFKKCITGKRIQYLIDGMASENINVCSLKRHDTLAIIINNLVDCFKLEEIDAAKYCLQLVSVIKQCGFDVISKTLNYLSFKRLKNAIETRIVDFNTTGLDIRTSRKGSNLVLSFGRAGRMSNGERDLLSFVASLVVFEILVSKKPGLLIIDEVFDYLDGANLLAAQYCLSKMIQNMKENGKTIIPIIMTHLDPAVFASYRFKGMSVHYLTGMSTISLNDNIARMLILRSKLKEQKNTIAQDYEKYLLHYHPQNWVIPDDILALLPIGFFSDSRTLREWLYAEVINHYLADLDYNALAVVIALRMKIEEKTVSLLPEDKREGYFNAHGSNQKLPYAEDCGCDIPELFYLLQPLYNDSAHLTNRSGSDIENKNKIESAYLKVSSSVVKSMVKSIFYDDVS